MRVRLVGEVTRITVEQGQMFSLELECVNDQDNVVQQGTVYTCLIMSTCIE